MRENYRVNQELLREYAHISDMRISNAFGELTAQETQEEVSLLQAVGGQFFQGIPCYNFV